MIRGWLFDIYPADDKIVAWIKDGETVHRIEKRWLPSLYVVSERTKLKSLLKIKEIQDLAHDFTFVKKFEKASDVAKSDVLQVKTRPQNLLRVAKKIESLDSFGTYRLYNVDVPPEQTYLYENDIFPLCRCEVDGSWKVFDNVMDTSYELPNLKEVHLKIIPKKEGNLPRFSDRIHSIRVNDMTIQSESESQTILDFIKTLSQLDPDLLITDGGDSFDFPFLMHRAKNAGVQDSLVLGREKGSILASKMVGRSYFSYGRMYWKPSAVKFQGRIHIDKKNCFLWENDSSLNGIYEISRICRMPIQTAARASIGKCMSSVQFYNATKQELLIPWKPTLAEIFKTRMDLMLGDRGGLILEPKIGVFENVGEIDFVSLYGNIMLKKNISAETISCKCCPDSQDYVPDLGYYICKRFGIVPRSIECLLAKRRMYSNLIAAEKKPEKKKIYSERKSALKWILVTSFGYLGFNNAKFGRIDAHMAVCAFARKLLLQAIRIAEKSGFTIIHGIVDSLWFYKKGATKSDYERLAKQIERETGFEASPELYKWIVFLPSKEEKFVPVANRYFGAHDDGTLKIRGIEARRHDTPAYFVQCQLEILKLFAGYDTIKEIKARLGEAEVIKNRYKNELLQGRVLLESLAFTNRLSKGADEFETNTVQKDAVLQLKNEGRNLNAGQKITYVINDNSRKKSKRVVPLEFAKSYDAHKYAEMLDDCCESVAAPFYNHDVSP